MGSTTPPLPYWQVNVPPQLRTAECPPFLLSLSAKDTLVVGTPDSNYKLLPWPEVQRTVADNRLGDFQRKPSDLRRYMEWGWGIKEKYRRVIEFLLTKRVQWTEPIIAEGAPFEKEGDLRILWNDWPYGLDPRIVHLVGFWVTFISSLLPCDVDIR